jgi:DNA-binding LacI/PurR family transcriptional regulator
VLPQSGATPKRQRTPTMQDVADLVGVSKQTVSAVINDKPGITDETRARVLAAIEQLGYRLDFRARSLRTGRTRTIALLVTDVASPFLSKIASAAEDCAYAAHYNLVLYNTRDSIDRERAYIDSVVQRSVDGVLAIAARDASTATASLTAAGIPVVTLDRIPLNYRGPSVTFDNRGAGRLAAEYLLSLGHRRLAHIGGPDSVNISQERLEGFGQVLADHGQAGGDFPFERAVAWGVQDGYDAMRRLLGRGAAFTAIFAAGDPLAIGVMRALREAGRNIPADVSILSIDDIDLAEFLYPPLRTVSQSIAEMANRGVQLLLDLLAGNTPAQTQVVIAPRLIVRESCRRLDTDHD